MTVIRTIVVPHDFSEHAQRAFEMATELAVLMDADVHLLHVVQPPAYAYGSELYAGAPLHLTGGDLDGLYESAKAQLEKVAESAAGMKRPFTHHVVEGMRIAEAIDHTAEQLAADLIVMGTHGRTGIAHLLLGSVAEATLRQAPCPVLTVPIRPARARATETAMSTAAHQGFFAKTV